jgi:hypothetical protein
MSQTSPQHDDDDDIAPGDIDTEAYQATGGRRGGGRGEFLWCVTTRNEDLIFPLADLRRMEPPSPADSTAYLHFSGVTVALSGVNLRRILHRITLQRCAALYEYKAGQKRPAGGEPVIEHIRFLDMTKAAPQGPK